MRSDEEAGSLSPRFRRPVTSLARRATGGSRTFCGLWRGAGGLCRPRLPPGGCFCPKNYVVGAVACPSVEWIVCTLGSAQCVDDLVGPPRPSVSVWPCRTVIYVQGERPDTAVRIRPARSTVLGPAPCSFTSRSANSADRAAPAICLSSCSSNPWDSSDVITV
jgi:hypothetical protein